MLKTILLDFDGTVFDTAEGITKSVQYSLEKFGIYSELQDLYCFCGPPLVDMYMQKYGLSAENADKAVAYYRERYQPIGLLECEVYAGITEMIGRLRNKGYKVAVATSKPEPTALTILENKGMSNVFDLVVGSCFDGTRSAKWEVVNAAIEMLNADKETTIMVGDRKYDVIGAHKCGVKCIGVGYGYAEPGEFEQAGADYVVDTVEQLEALLLSL